MQPFQPFYLGREAPPAPRLTSSQRCFRTPDIEEVGSTTRHLTCFEMLGNFAFGDYFKEEAIGFAWELSLGAFGFEPSQLWVTVFGGDDELGLGPDTEAIELWKAQGVPEERIVPLPRSENFWQAGPRARAVPARSSTSIAARTSASPATGPATTPTASSSTGTSSSPPTTCMRTVRSPSCRPRTSTPASASSGWR